MGNAGRLTWHAWCTHCIRMYWSVIYVIFSAQGRYDALFTLCGKSFSMVVCSLSCGIPLSSSCFFSVPSALTCTYAPFLSCVPLSHAHRCSSAYMPALSLSLSFCASLSWLLCAVSWFHSFQSVCLATGIFADVSVLQPQPLRERERERRSRGGGR